MINEFNFVPVSTDTNIQSNAIVHSVDLLKTFIISHNITLVFGTVLL